MISNLLTISATRFLAKSTYNHQYTQDLEGKVFCIDITDYNTKFYIKSTGANIEADFESDIKANVTISADMINLISFLYKQRTQGVLHDKVVVNGEIDTAEKFQKLFSSMHLDLEELLSEKIGDVPAFYLSEAMQVAQSWSKKSFFIFKTQVAEYLQEESNILPTKVAIKKHVNNVTSLRHQTENIQKRIESIQKALGEKS